MNILDERSKQLRRSVIRMVEADKRGHIGSALSLIEILRVLYDTFLKVIPEDPSWDDRDRFILSKGHGCLALYAILADKGFFSQQEFDNFCKPNSFLGGHPERGKTPGIEVSTGSLGHGLPVGVGMALAAKIRQKSHRIVVLMGDGETNEGSVWEAAMSAAKHKLENLITLIDHNKLQSYGPTSDVLDMHPMKDKWTSFGFSTIEVDGHSIEQLEQLFGRLPLSEGKPTAIICHTIKGKGISYAEGQPSWHHKSGLNFTDFNSMYKCLE
jgi:transketolase